MRKKKMNKTRMIALGTVAAVAVVGYFVIYPKIVKTYENVDEIIKQKQELMTYTSDSSNISAAKLLDSLTKNSDEVQKTILKEGDEIRLVNTLEELAEKKGVAQRISMVNGDLPQSQGGRGEVGGTKKPGVITPAEKLEGTNLEKLEFQLVTSSSFETLLKYLHYLESTNLYIKITGIEIVRPDDVASELPAHDFGVVATIEALTYIESSETDGTGTGQTPGATQ